VLSFLEPERRTALARIAGCSARQREAEQSSKTPIARVMSADLHIDRKCFNRFKSIFYFGRRRAVKTQLSIFLSHVKARRTEGLHQFGADARHIAIITLPLAV
jgi:hypothetical protein